MMRYKSSSFSISKNKISQNQDSIIAPIEIDDYIIFAIADGVGGVANGDKASTFITNYCSETMRENPYISLKALFENLWLSFNDYAIKNKYYEMASTFTFCRVDNYKFEIAHVGDCRVYIKSKKSTLKQITTDHNVLSQVNTKYSKDIEMYYRNLITSSFSTRDKYKGDFIESSISDIDYICIFSDGIYKTINDMVLKNIFSHTYDAETITNKLKNLIQDSSPKDDYSAVIVQLS